MDFQTIPDPELLEMLHDQLLDRMTDLCKCVDEIIDTDEINDLRLRTMIGQYDEVCEKIRSIR